MSLHWDSAENLHGKWVHVRNWNSGMYLNVKGCSESLGADVEQWYAPGCEDWGSTRWRLERQFGNVFCLMNDCHQYLNIRGSSKDNCAPAEIFQSAGITDWSSARWVLEGVPWQYGAYNLKNYGSGRYLNVRGSSDDKGAVVQQYFGLGCQNWQGCQWLLEPVA